MGLAALIQRRLQFDFVQKSSGSEVAEKGTWMFQEVSKWLVNGL